MSCSTQRANATVSGDPTNTLPIRQALLQEIRRRFRRVRGLVRTTVGYENDALKLTSNSGVKHTTNASPPQNRLDTTDGTLYAYVRYANPNKHGWVRTTVPMGRYKQFHTRQGAGLTANAEPQDTFDFDSDSGRVGQFYQWLVGALRDEILEPVPASDVADGEHWLATYLRRAYLQGWNQATGLLFQRGASVTNYDDEDILNRPIPVSQLQRLYTRAYENLEDITDDAADVLRDELATGLAEGVNPREIATRLTNELRDIQHTRAEVLARTEVINSHSTATLDRYEDAGVDVVSHGEWATADDDRVCRICRALEGKEFTTQEMRDTTFQMEDVSFEVRLKPPAHPSGRCVILPSVGGQPPQTPLEERLPDKPVEQTANARVVA